MPDIAGGTPRTAQLVAELDGQRYLVAQQAHARSWDVSRIPAQEADTVREYTWPLTSFHEGAGFSYDGLPNVYDYADGWDASTPGKLTTWARHAVGDSETVTDYRGWLRFHGGFLYMLKGRYVYKYTLSTTAGSTWSGASSKDFGSGYAVAGRPEAFKGKLYVPTITSDAPQRFWQLTTIGSPDTWTQGPSGKLASAFRRWKNLLAGIVADVSGEYNIVQTVSDDPMTAGDWSGATAVGDPAQQGTDLAIMNGDVQVLKRDGMFHMDENLYTVDDLPDLQTTTDIFNGVPTEKAHGKLLISHKSGLIRWDQNSGSYRFIGPEQEGALEGSLGKGWGRVTGIVPYGRYAFVMTYDATNTMGSIIGLEPSRGGRGPLIPHVYHQTTSGWFEGGCIVESSDGTKTYLCTIRVASGGTSAAPWVFQLPRSAMTPANDPNVNHARDNCNFYTSRIASPGRDVQKSWRTVELWTEMTAADLSLTPGLQVWASVDGGSYVQLLDSAGSAATIKANGFQRVFFPKTSAAVGHYVQLRLTVPAKAGSETDVAVTVREMTLRGELHPLMTNAITALFVLGPGEAEDKTSIRRTVQKQKADLQALADPTAAAVTFKDIWGGTGYAKVTNVTFKELVFQGESEPRLVATVNLRERPYG